MAKILIALDNGHGLNTPGKRTPIFSDGTKSSYTGKNFMHEWEFNRRVVQLLKLELERFGFAVIEVSPTEADTPIEKRCQVANNAGAQLYVSIHANALKDGIWGNPEGIETLTYGSGESLRIGKIIQKQLISATGLRDRGMKDGSWLGVVKGTKMPAILTENGFMDNIREAKLLLSEDYRKKVAVAHAKGICEVFGVKYVGDKPAYATIPTTVNGVSVPGIVVGNYVSLHWKALDMVGNKKYTYQFYNNNKSVKFTINGKEIDGTLYNGDSYIRYDYINPDFIVTKVGDGFDFSFKQPEVVIPIEKPTTTPVKDSIDVLVDNGIIKSPEYWRGLLAGNVTFNKDYFKQLLDNVAGKL